MSRRKHSPGCHCCRQVLCVPAETSCSPSYFNHWYSQIRFFADTSSPLVPGTAWRTVYRAVLTNQFNINVSENAYNTDTGLLLCELTFDPIARRWRGYTDSPPQEPDYEYRFWLEIASDLDLTVNPAAVNCHRRFWASDRDNVPLTDDFSIGFSAGGAAVAGVTDPICFEGCSRAGNLLPWAGVLPRFLTGYPRQLRLTIDGLSSPAQGDLSGEYLLRTDVYPQFPAIGLSCPPPDGYPGSPPCAAPWGFRMASRGCDWSYVKLWAFGLLADEVCVGPDVDGHVIAVSVASLGTVTFFIVRRYYPDVMFHPTQYCLDVIQFAYSPTIQANGNSVDYLNYLGTIACTTRQTPPNGYAFPPSVTVSFDSWD